MKRLQKHSRNMLQGPLLSGLIIYTVPIMLTSILQLLFNAADLVIVGNFCGSISVAAVGATGAISNLIVNLFIGLSVGAGVGVAQALGSRDAERVHRFVHTAIPTAIIGGLILSVLGIFLAKPLLTLMDTPDTVLPLSTVYMRIYFGGMVFNMVYNFCASMLRAAGDTKSPLIFLTIAGVINVLLNVVFVTVFHMNVAGVALATTISQAISAVLVVNALMRRTDECRLEIKKLRVYKPQLMKMMRVGFPAGIQGAMFSISNVIIQSSVNSFGDVFMSGNAAAGNIEGFAWVVINSFHQSAQNFTGQNVGAGQFDRVKKIFTTSLLCSVVAGLVMGFGMRLMGESLLSIYISDSETAIFYGLKRFNYILLFYFIAGAMEVCTGCLRGLGSSFLPMIISVMGVCGVRLMWVYTIFQVPEYHTPECLYLSYPVSWMITFLLQFLVLRYEFKKRSKLHT